MVYSKLVTGLFGISAIISGATAAPVTGGTDVLQDLDGLAGSADVTTHLIQSGACSDQDLFNDIIAIIQEEGQECAHIQSVLKSTTLTAGQCNLVADAYEEDVDAEQPNLLRIEDYYACQSASNQRTLLAALTNADTQCEAAVKALAGKCPNQSQRILAENSELEQMYSSWRSNTSSMLKRVL